MKKFGFVLAIASLLVAYGCNKAAKPDNEDSFAAGNIVADSNNGGDGDVIQLTTADFLEKVVNYKDRTERIWNYRGDKPAVVDFYADWCGPCRMMAPLLKKAARKYAGQVYIYKVDVDKETEVASSFGIQGIPTLMFIPVGRDPEIIVGAIGEEELLNKIDNILK